MRWFRRICLMMTPSNGYIFRVIGVLWGPGNSPVNSPHKGQWRRTLMFSLICVWTNGWVKTRDASDLRRHHAHCCVTVNISRESNPPWTKQITKTKQCKTKQYFAYSIAFRAASSFSAELYFHITKSYHVYSVGPSCNKQLSKLSLVVGILHSCDMVRNYVAIR